MPRTTTGESVLERAVRIVASFRVEERSLTVSEIARRSNLHIATASRLVEELVRLGLLERNADRSVRIGLRMWELGLRASPTLGLREAAMPVMRDLQAIVGHHTQLGILEGTEVIFVERLSSPKAVINYSKVAGRLPIHASSSGHVLLAHANSDLQEKVLASELERFTSETITDARRLRAALAAVRRQGFALLAGHLHPDAAGAAVPVRDHRGRVVAALSVIVPNDSSARSTVPMLQAAARAVSRVMAPPRSVAQATHNSQSLRTR